MDPRVTREKTQICGFCTKILREFAIELGISNDFLAREFLRKKIPNPTYEHLIPPNPMSRIPKSCPRGTKEKTKKEPDSAAFVPRFSVNSP